MIHNMFISPFSISVLVFSMQSMCDNEDECLEGLATWLTSIIIHTFDERTGSMSPIVFVGTHKDIVRDPAVHERINTILRDKFHQSNAWNHVLKYDKHQGQRSRAVFNFFPVDNTRGRADPTVQDLMATIEGTLARADYVNKMVPLQWLKCLDLFMDKKRDHTCAVAYADVKSLAGNLGIVDNEVDEFLTFMNKVCTVRFFFCCFWWW